MRRTAVPSGDYVTEYWNDAATLETAQDITVVGGEIVRDETPS